jgi:hypothetical protein
MRFRKKPIVIDAVRFQHWNTSEVADFLGGSPGFGSDGDPIVPFVLIETLEGTMRANDGDWIIRGVAGEYYPCKDSIFRATYEATEDSDPIS